MNAVSVPARGDRSCERTTGASAVLRSKKQDKSSSFGKAANHKCFICKVLSNQTLVEFVRLPVKSSCGAVPVRVGVTAVYLVCDAAFLSAFCKAYLRYCELYPDSRLSGKWSLRDSVVLTERF